MVTSSPIRVSWLILHGVHDRCRPARSSGRRSGCALTSPRITTFIQTLLSAPIVDVADDLGTVVDKRGRVHHRQPAAIGAKHPTDYRQVPGDVARRARTGPGRCRRLGGRSAIGRQAGQRERARCAPSRSVRRRTPRLRPSAPCGREPGLGRNDDDLGVNADARDRMTRVVVGRQAPAAPPTIAARYSNRGCQTRSMIDVSTAVGSWSSRCISCCSSGLGPVPGRCARSGRGCRPAAGPSAGSPSPACDRPPRSPPRRCAAASSSTSR